MGLRDRDLAPGKKQTTRTRMILALGLALLTAWAIRMGVRTWAYEPVVVSESTMEPTLHKGEVLYVKKRFSRADLTNGSLVWIEHPLNPGYRMIRKIVAMPGETVEVRQGRLLLNGRPAEGNAQAAEATAIPSPGSPGSVKRDEPEDSDSPNDNSRGEAFFDRPAFKIPDDSFYVLGETAGLDSRHFGAVPGEKILGLIR